MTQVNRLNKIEKSLTPKQAVVHWLQEIETYRNPRDYVLYLRGRPETEAPIYKLTEQITKALRQAMRGSSKEFVDRTVRSAVKDVVFLVKLHLAVNFELMRKMREWRLSQIALAESLGKMHIDMLLCNFITDIADRVNFQTPYPLDPETSACVESAIRHHVYTWEDLEGECIIQDWLWEYLVDQGAKELPISSFEYPSGKYQPNVDQSNEAEVRACFDDETKFQLFRSGRDYTHGLASVTNAEYTRHHESIVSGIKELTKSGRVQAGWIVHLEAVPIPFLRDVPLVEGKWLNRGLVELAEWGALLKSKGYQVKEDEEANVLANVQFKKDGDQKVTPEELLAFRRKAQLFLKKYSGRTKDIDGRTFIHFNDYCSWRGRKVKGDLRKLVSEGVVTASWNRWTKEHGSDKTVKVGEVLVSELSCHIGEGSYYACHNSVDQLREREALLDSIRIFSFKPDRKENLVQEWKESVAYCMTELYAFREAVASIQKSYFDGQPVVFADFAQELAQTITEAETTVNNFNVSFAEDRELFTPFDLEALRKNADSQVSQVVSYIIDVAKAEALDSLGEHDIARELAERYL